MTKFVQEQRAKLEQELQRLNAEIAELEQYDPANDQFRDINNTDDDDVAESEDHSRIQARLDAVKEQQRVVSQALAKITDGSYGKCQRCGKTIPEGRLEVVPWALYDIECEEIIESGR